MARDLRSDALTERPEARFSDVEARQVLALAAERERALGASVSATQLRAAAIEAGISAAAFDDAVLELRATPARRGRRRSGLIATVIGVVLLAGASAAALSRGVHSAASTPLVERMVAGAGEGTPAVGSDGESAPMAASCGRLDGIPADRLRALAGSLYPELLAPGNRHRWLTVAVRFDAQCHVKGHILTRRGKDDGADEVLRSLFPAAPRDGWQVSGGADVGPWTFEEGKPEIVWGVERAPAGHQGAPRQAP